MSKIVKVSNGDYSIQVQPGGNIILDTTGTAVGRDASGQYGNIVIWGNLDVKGATTTVESTNTTVTDNIFTINAGDVTGSGISSALSYQGGWAIDRGASPTANIFFNEQVSHYDASTAAEVSGTFFLKTGSALTGLQLRTITTDTSGDLAFDLQGGSKALAIVNSGGTIGVSGHSLANDATNYAGTPGTTLQAYHIPNVQWNYLNVYSTLTPLSVTPSGTAVVAGLQYPITNGATPYASILATGSSGSTGQLQFSVNSIQQGYFSTNGLTVGNVRISGDTIQDISSNNLTLGTGTSNIEVDGVLNLDNQTWNSPSYTSGKTKLYSSSTIGPGATGLYITNSNVQVQDELISRRKAVLLSILL
jgi:hypothetical protein